MKYTSRSRTVDAVQWLGDNIEEIRALSLEGIIDNDDGTLCINWKGVSQVEIGWYVYWDAEDDDYVIMTDDDFEYFFEEIDQ